MPNSRPSQARGGATSDRHSLSISLASAILGANLGANLSANLSESQRISTNLSESQRISAILSESQRILAILSAKPLSASSSEPIEPKLNLSAVWPFVANGAVSR